MAGAQVKVNGPAASASVATRILGIDPGLRSTGFGLIDSLGSQLRYVASGCIKTGEGSLPERLKIILDGVREVIATYKPDQAAVEIVFVNVNPQSTLLLGQARGAAICGAVSCDLPVGRIHRPAGQAGSGRTRQGRQGAGQPHGAAPAVPRRRTVVRRGRRPGLRHLPRPRQQRPRRHGRHRHPQARRPPVHLSPRSSAHVKQS
jgi:hypothetical protein